MRRTRRTAKMMMKNMSHRTRTKMEKMKMVTTIKRMTMKKPMT
jgi:hypothetical protein